jgi:exonuclease 3'-5' domain-containing protein 1
VQEAQLSLSQSGREIEKIMTASIESMEYEQARNLTLLFFFERLIDKNEPRTLHDLSCQFGAPGFTKEMRQIAGGSQSGKS